MIKVIKWPWLGRYKHQYRLATVIKLYLLLIWFNSEKLIVNPVIMRFPVSKDAVDPLRIILSNRHNVKIYIFVKIRNWLTIIQFWIKGISVRNNVNITFRSFLSQGMESFFKVTKFEIFKNRLKRRQIS